MELLDYYDNENKEKIGTEERDIVHKKNLWHREVAIFILNEQNEVLIQKRSANKKQAPNKYSICAGHIDSGENEVTAAIREVSEEIGVNLKEKDLEFIELFRNHSEGNNHFKYMYFARIDKKIEEMKMQEEEVSELKYISLDELKDIIKNKNPEYTFSKKEYMGDIIKFLERKMK